MTTTKNTNTTKNASNTKVTNHLDLWEVFIQAKPGLSHKHAGCVQAVNAEMALKNARDVYSRRMEGTCLWVIPSKHIRSSEGMDKEIFFDPADDKLYNHPTF